MPQEFSSDEEKEAYLSVLATKISEEHAGLLLAMIDMAASISGKKEEVSATKKPALLELWIRTTATMLLQAEFNSHRDDLTPETREAGVEYVRDMLKEKLDTYPIEGIRKAAMEGAKVELQRMVKGTGIKRSDCFGNGKDG